MKISANGASLLLCTSVFYVLFHFCAAVPLYIVADTGELVDYPPEDVVALWPLPNGECADSVDAQLVEHSGRYTIAEWVYDANDYEDWGAFGTRAAIYDLATLVDYAYTQGVWHHPRDCDEIRRLVLSQIIKPATHQLNLQGRGTFTARMHGLVIDLLCRPRNSQEFETCTTQQISIIGNMVAQGKRPVPKHKKKRSSISADTPIGGGRSYNDEIQIRTKQGSKVRLISKEKHDSSGEDQQQHRPQN